MSSSDSGRILVVDDEADVLRALRLVLERGGFEFRGVRSAEEALELLAEESYDLVITDLQMPGFPGQELVQEVVRRWPDTPVVVLTAHGAVSTAVELMQVGAADYLLKPIDPAELLIRIQALLEARAVREERDQLREQVALSAASGSMVGEDPEMRKIFGMIDRVAENTAPVLIRGEPGTGKELVADAIHRRRNDYLQSLAVRAGEEFDAEDHPFVPVNCGAFTRTLLASQLFGHKRGSFTGADADQAGVFVAARRGTLFLDEITEIDKDMQVMLLRAIQEREVVPLGSTTAVHTPARIITATNRPLVELVDGGRFRQDLYFRIKVVEIELPPLRDRRGDIPLLSQQFVSETTRKNGQEPRTLTPDVLQAFHVYPWPGNVRELHNAIEHALALGRHADRIGLEDLPSNIREFMVSGGQIESRGATQGLDSFLSYDAMARLHICEALRRTDGVRSRAARLLQIDRNRLARLIRKYGIDDAEWRGPTETAS